MIAGKHNGFSLTIVERAWDSEIFGFKCGFLHVAGGNTDEGLDRASVDVQLTELMEDAKKRGFRFLTAKLDARETDLANLCLRLTISRIIAEHQQTAPLNFIVLDEVFGSQDAGRRRNLMETLNKLSNKFSQIFLITHIEEIKEYMDNVIYVRESGDGTSQAKLLGAGE